MSETAESILNVIADRGPHDTAGLSAIYAPASPDFISETCDWLYRNGYIIHGCFAWNLTPAGYEAIGR